MTMIQALRPVNTHASLSMIQALRPVNTHASLSMMIQALFASREHSDFSEVHCQHKESLGPQLSI